ncbi:MAG: hypothetical protein IKF14_09575 [Atopobiaceae bacterium]|nr:hypothetical protein [Atopobiaceae bacterium]
MNQRQEQTGGDARKVKMRCVTHRTWRLIQRMMDEAESSLPERYVRKRVQVRGEVFAREVAARAKIREVDPRGREVWCERRTNLGTRKWPYVVDDCENIGCFDVKDRCILYMPGDRRYYRYIEKCVCIYG